MLGSLLVAGIVGVALGRGSYPIIGIVVAAIVGGALALRPVLIQWLVIFGSLILAGLIELYLPVARPVIWLFSGLALALGVLTLLIRFSSIANTAAATGSTGQSASPLAWAAAYFIFTCITTVAQTGVSVQTGLGLKAYFQLWGLILAVAWLDVSKESVRKIVKFLVFLALIQIPFALHQFIVLAPQRATDRDAMRQIVAADIVTGTFGGSMNGGGRSLLLAIIACIAIAAVVGLRAAGRISKRQAIVMIGIAVSPLAISEVKAFLVFLPMTIFILGRRYFMANPFQAVAAGLATLISLSFLTYVYAELMPSARMQRNADSVSTFVADVFGSDRGYGALRLNRGTTYLFWFKENVIEGNAPDVLVGRGAGTSTASRFSDEALDATVYRGMGIGLTAASALLWDVGVIGTILLFGMVIAALRQTLRVIRDTTDPDIYTAARATQIGLLVVILSFFHSNYLVFDVAFQCIFSILIGLSVKLAKLTPSPLGAPAKA